MFSLTSVLIKREQDYYMFSLTSVLNKRVQDYYNMFSLTSVLNKREQDYYNMFSLTSVLNKREQDYYNMFSLASVLNKRVQDATSSLCLLYSPIRTETFVPYDAYLQKKKKKGTGCNMFPLNSALIKRERELIYAL